jgi:hypothetical protein
MVAEGSTAVTVYPSRALGDPVVSGPGAYIDDRGALL